MALRLYNTSARALEEFKPLGEVVRVYSCGLTVQGQPHVGHMRAALTRDILVRWLAYLGYRVRSIENFTDVDDKIIEKQREQNTDWRVIAQSNIERYLAACVALNIRLADFYPRASQHIEEIIRLVEVLIAKGYAYEKAGDVYYRVRRFPGYGKLSGKSIDDLLSGARIEPTEHKEDPLDFALWKAAKPGEPSWFSPWGKGRPGWHIECSAMSQHHLGESFDIHTGGEDLIFPHHENEIAQSEGATGKPFVRYWLHNGFVRLTGEKMSKSTGHFKMIEEILKEYSANTVRLFLLKTHYRNPVEFSRERLEEAKAAYARLANYLERNPGTDTESEILKREEFVAAMNDDLNTPQALGIIFDLVALGHENNHPGIPGSIRHMLDALGFQVATSARDDLSPRLIDVLLEVRNGLRGKKDFQTSDEIRSRLLKLGIVIDDTKDVSTYHWQAS